jgi:hypothetical protein
VSIGSANNVEEHVQRHEPLSRSQRPQRGHNRAASLQIPPQGVSSPGAGPQSGMFSWRNTSTD